MKRLIYAIAALAAIATSCREDELVVPTEYDILPVPTQPGAVPRGMYLLNEGNMGSNKSSIDYVDFRNALYSRNMYAQANPSVVMELGDVGNDIAIYGSKLYAVINCSHKVEVMDAHTLRRIGKIDIPNCRYIKFHRGNAYVSSYVGPVQIDPDAQLGAVFRVDTASLEVTGKCTVGYQPDELEIVGEYIYVANSGGYRMPLYDYTVSVVEIQGFKQVRKIPVGINLHRIRADKYGRLWVTSRGNYGSVRSKLFVLERANKFTNEMRVTDTLDIPCSNLVIRGDSLYYYATEWSNAEERNSVSYGIIDVRTKQKIADSFITDGTEGDIEVPYGLNINPSTGDIFITDAKNYVSSGSLHCYGRDGHRKWSIRTGDIPAHTVFLEK